MAVSGSPVKINSFSVRRILEASRAIVQGHEWPNHGDELKQGSKSQKSA